MENTNLITIFLTGLLTGGLTCMAVQGGLLAATIAQREEEKLQEGIKTTGQALPLLSFLLTKLLAYTLLGLLLGWIGSFLTFSPQTTAVLQIAVGVFMIGTALNILSIHPIFRYFVIQPPRFLTRIIRRESKSKDVFAPAILGAFTIFIPCGTTQAMMALAVASGSPLYGAAILFAFTIGTSPVFFLLGYFATKLGRKFEHTFMKIAAYAIILLALFNINNGIALTGSNTTLTSVAKSVWCVFAICYEDQSVLTATPVTQEVDIIIGQGGYSPRNFTVKSGEPVTLHLKNTSGGGCAQAFTIPSLGIQKVVSLGQSDDVVFTPSQPGTIRFMCSMGMYEGMINVI